MLVLDNTSDQEFLEKILKLLSYEVIAMSKGLNLSEELIDHFPDIVFASTLGKNEKILAALVKIKQARGKPKLVFMRQEKDSAPLNPEQKKVIDGVLYSPIDPFKLIEVLSDTTGEEVKVLRKRYLEMLNADRDAKKQFIKGSAKKESDPNQYVSQFQSGDKDYGDTHVVGKTSSKTQQVVRDEKKVERVSYQIVGDPPLISDPMRKKKYDSICATFAKVDKVSRNIDNKTLRELQKMQSSKIKEDDKIKKDRKHFIKTLFTMTPIDGKKK